jgi:LacI family transcriptional regulator
MSTIGDVAKHAGVSTMTVSRVVNNSGYISDKTRQRVEIAITELGYIPNALARGLRFKQTKTLALIVTDITNPFFTTMARGVEDKASEKGFSVIFCNTDESPSKQAEYLNVLIQKQVDGVLLVPAWSSGETVLALQERETCVVVLDRRLRDVQVDTVRCDSELASYQLTRYLLELGHQHVALLNGPLTVSTAVDRAAGYMRAMAKDGFTDVKELVFSGKYSQKSGYQMAQEALATRPRPTAILTANNFIAIGAFQALNEAGLRIPEDISLVTFDDLAPAIVTQPFMTVMNQPAYEMGIAGTDLLIARLSGDGPTEVQDIVMQMQMVVRKSSGPPPSD